MRGVLNLFELIHFSRGTLTLQSGTNKIRFFKYNLFGYGVPALLLLAVDLASYFVDDVHFRPGFGEESCWFTSCSGALSLFLYGPIGLFMGCNICLFGFAAVKLRQMQRNVTRNVKIISRQSTRCDSSPPKHQDLGSLSSRAILFARQLSSVDVKKNNQKKALGVKQDLFLTYAKLFVVMGLTWTFEVITWYSSDASSPPPEALIIVVNFLNIFQVKKEYG